MTECDYSIFGELYSLLFLFYRWPNFRRGMKTLIPNTTKEPLLGLFGERALEIYTQNFTRFYD